METHSDLNTFVPSKKTVVTIGTFDGVHVGHRQIISRLIATAKAEDMEAVVLTFFPHPRMVLQQDADIKLINSIEERSDLLESLGLDHLIIHPFTKDFSRMNAEVFVEDILVKQLQAKKVIIGYDHRFGRSRSADISDLRNYGSQLGFTVEEISKQELDDVAISSTKIRKALVQGAIERANGYLGHPFMLSGTVVEGKKLGRTLGYPTANLEVTTPYKLIPAKGVYVSTAIINKKQVYGMTNIGTNPTVGNSGLTIETYFFNFHEDLYGSPLQIQLLKRIRDEQRFASLDQLVQAMKTDAVFTQNYIATL